MEIAKWYCSRISFSRAEEHITMDLRSLILYSSLMARREKEIGEVLQFKLWGDEERMNGNSAAVLFWQPMGFVDSSQMELSMFQLGNKFSPTVSRLENENSSWTNSNRWPWPFPTPTTTSFPFNPLDEIFIIACQILNLLGLPRCCPVTQEFRRRFVGGSKVTIFREISSFSQAASKFDFNVNALSGISCNWWRDLQGKTYLPIHFFASGSSSNSQTHLRL